MTRRLRVARNALSAVLTLVATMAVSVRVGADAAPAEVQPNWDSIRASYSTPRWFTDGKFGIFIHWGLYAVPAHHNEWYARHMYSNAGIAQWHAEHYGPQDKFGYKDFIPLFKAERYDPDGWAALFKAAGARYVVPVAEHHDGFAMYDSSLTRWCAARMGPKRDLIGDLARSVRAQGLVFGLSSHRMEHHDFMYPTLKIKTDLFDPAYADFYGPPQPGDMNDGNATPAFQADWLARCKELVDKYHPQMVWFDNGVNSRRYDAVKLQFAAYYYNRARTWPGDSGSVTLSTKDSAYLAGSILDFEKAGRAPKTIQTSPWQVDDQIATNSWGYVTEIRYRKAESILGELVDTVSKGGNLLLNISPMADGTIPAPQQEILKTIGAYLAVNGEAIYGTHPWTRNADGGFHFTVKGDNLYALSLARPTTAEVVLPSLAGSAGGKITRVQLLGYNGPDPAFTHAAAGLHVTLPADVGRNPIGYTLKITGANLTAVPTKDPATP